MVKPYCAVRYNSMPIRPEIKIYSHLYVVYPGFTSLICQHLVCPFQGVYASILKCACNKYAQG